MTYRKSMLTESQATTRRSSPRMRGPSLRIPLDSRLRGNERKGALAPLRPIELVEDLLDLGAEAGRDVFARERVGDVGGEEADLGAAIEAAALEFQAVEILHARERDHRVGQLNFAAGAAVLFCQEIENLGLQDVAAG